MNKDIIILAIETSCDETAAAVVKNGKEILSNVVSSQINTHSKFGGVIPEVASRLHTENISLVIDEALTTANIKNEDLDYIAVTYGPGLIGCLHVGLQAAKALSLLCGIPLIGINHLAGHIYANNFVTELEFPLLALVVSGGHSELVYMEKDYQFEIIGSTMDDAIGEAFDKTARLLNLGYPGGPIIDKLAKSGEAKYKFPQVKIKGKYDFSFSGLKSACFQLIKRLERNKEEYLVEDITSSFQESVLGLLLDKSLLALSDYPVKQFILAGGVAANSRLRELIMDKIPTSFPKVKIVLPPLWCCTDNAAMIAACAYQAVKHGVSNDSSLKADSSLTL